MDMNIENWARLCESMLDEDGREGHKTGGSMDLSPEVEQDSPLRKAISKSEDFDIARAFQTLIDCVAWMSKEEMKKFTKEVGLAVKTHGTSETGIGGILQAFYTLMEQRLRHREGSDRDYDMQMHKINPKDWKHPDRVDPKKIPDRELPK